MRNCLEFPKPLYFGRKTGLNFGVHGAVCSPMDSGDSGSTNCEIPFPAKKFSFGVFLFGPEFWIGDSFQSQLFSCSFISSISLCIASIFSFAWLSFSSFSEAFLFACSWFANFSFSFCSCCIFCWTLSSSLSMVSSSWSSSSSSSFSCACCSVGCSWIRVVFSALAFRRASSFALRSLSVMFEGSGVREIPLPSSWWSSSWSVSARMFFFDLFYIPWFAGGAILGSSVSSGPRCARIRRVGSARRDGVERDIAHVGVGCTICKST
jgi:hypothetical protein